MTWECKVCGAKPDASGLVEHGRGCFTVQAEGGGTSYVDPPRRAARPQAEHAQAVRFDHAYFAAKWALNEVVRLIQAGDPGQAAKVATWGAFEGPSATKPAGWTAPTIEPGTPADATGTSPSSGIDGSVMVIYKNHRGETRPRCIIPQRLFWGRTEWHHEMQWLLRVYDVEKKESRDFALAGVAAWAPDATTIMAARDEHLKSTPNIPERELTLHGEGVGIRYRLSPEASRPGIEPDDVLEALVAEVGQVRSNNVAFTPESIERLAQDFALRPNVLGVRFDGGKLYVRWPMSKVHDFAARPKSVSMEATDGFERGVSAGDPIFTVVRSETVGVPNESPDGFPRSELLKYGAQRPPPLSPETRAAIKRAVTENTPDWIKHEMKVLSEPNVGQGPMHLARCPDCGGGWSELGQRKKDGTSCTHGGRLR